MADYALTLSSVERDRYRSMAALAWAEEARSWRAAGVRAGASVADIGCGPGAVLRLLGEQVGPAGRALGVDNTAEAVIAANAEVQGLLGVGAQVGDAAATGLPNDVFDVVMCRHVLAHNGGREPAIVAHLAELARPGGTVYLVDVDRDAAWIDPSDPDVDDLHARYLEFQLQRGNDLWVGRRLGALLEGAGLDVETYRAGGAVVRLSVGARPPAWAAQAGLVAAGFATPSDVRRWDHAFRRLDRREQRPWASSPVVIAFGRKPERSRRQC
ncbi:methyltransferase domain-containing protein [Actinomycetes bacterium KLBMP 9759]